MLKFGLGKDLAVIIADGSLQDIVFRLVQIAESEEWVIELVVAARKANPNNARLEAFEKRIKPNILRSPKASSPARTPDPFIGQENPDLISTLSWLRIKETERNFYTSLCNKHNLEPSKSILNLLLKKVNLHETQEKEESSLLTSFQETLQGSKRIKITVSQMFKMADLLTQPETVKARKIYDVFTNIHRMRRAFSKRKSFDLGALGSLKPVITISDKYDNFWQQGLPDFRFADQNTLHFTPLELSLTELFKKLQLHLEYISEISLMESLSKMSTSSILNKQLSGRLHIYPPGIGVIRLAITLEFKEAVYIEVVSQIARDIEELLFTNADGLEEPYETILLDIINQVTDKLFTKKAYSFEDRRWRPPITSYVIYDTNDFKPEENINELTHLIALAPGNHEDRRYLRNRIEKALSLPRWQKENVLALSGQEAALFFVPYLSARGKKKRKQLLQWLDETCEIVYAAAYAQQAYLDEIEKITLRRLLDDSWFPNQPNAKKKFDYLYGLLTTMHRTMQAVMAIRSHLERLGPSILKDFAEGLWAFSNPVNTKSFKEGLSYIQDWANKSLKNINNKRLIRLESILEDMLNFPPPFKSQKDGYSKAVDPQVQEQLEKELLAQLWNLDRLLKTSGESQIEEIDQISKNIFELKKQLGL